MYKSTGPPDWEYCSTVAQVLKRALMRIMMTFNKHCELITDSLNQYFPKKQSISYCWLFPHHGPFYHFASSWRKTSLHWLTMSSNNNLLWLLKKMRVGEWYDWVNPIFWFCKWSSVPSSHTQCCLNHDRSINAFFLFLCLMTMVIQ